MASGAVIGAFVPAASYTLAHREFDLQKDLASQWVVCVMILGALLFSARSVYQWARAAFAEGPKALGFVVLLEGILVASKTEWLGIAALGILVGLNSVATAKTLRLRRP